MTWHYEVVQFKNHVGLYEFYVEDNKLDFTTTDPILVADDINDLKQQLQTMLSDIERHPMVDEDDMPEWFRKDRE